MTNYFDKQGNYINCENLSLAEIYHRAFALGVESVAIDKRPQGDLISREALKNNITEIFESEEKIDKKWATGLKYSLKIIDNAPTVELCYQTTSCLDCKMYDKEKYNCPRFCEVIRSAIEERQQGEWIWSPVADDGTVSGCCNKCSFSHMFIGGHTAQYNFCPNCGAKMLNKWGKAVRNDS